MLSVQILSCEISEGIQNLVALVCFVSFLLPCFSAVYFCGSDVLTKKRQPVFIMVCFSFFNPKAAMVTEC